MPLLARKNTNKNEKLDKKKEFSLPIRKLYFIFACRKTK